MAMSTMCPCTSKHHRLPHFKCVLGCCGACPIIVLPSHEANKDTTSTCPTIIFHVYRNATCCTVHGRRPYHEQKTYSFCSTVSISDRTAKAYTVKELVLLET